MILLQDFENCRFSKDERPLIWMNDNPFIIYGTDYKNHGEFDIRDNNPKWNICHELLDIREYCLSNVDDVVKFYV